MLSTIISAIVGLISGVIAAFFSHILLLKKIRREAEEKLKFDIHNKQIEAYQNFWKLLGPTSEYNGKHNLDRIIKQNDLGYYIDQDAVDSFFDSFHKFFILNMGCL